MLETHKDVHTTITMTIANETECRYIAFYPTWKLPVRVRVMGLYGKNVWNDR